MGEGHARRVLAEDGEERAGSGSGLGLSPRTMKMWRDQWGRSLLGGRESEFRERERERLVGVADL